MDGSDDEMRLFDLLQLYSIHWYEYMKEGIIMESPFHVICVFVLKKRKAACCKYVNPDSTRTHAVLLGSLCVEEGLRHEKGKSSG